MNFPSRQKWINNIFLISKWLCEYFVCSDHGFLLIYLYFSSKVNYVSLVCLVSDSQKCFSFSVEEREMHAFSLLLARVVVWQICLQCGNTHSIKQTVLDEIFIPSCTLFFNQAAFFPRKIPKHNWSLISCFVHWCR